MQAVRTQTFVDDGGFGVGRQGRLRTPFKASVLSDAMTSFGVHWIECLEVGNERAQALLSRSRMRVTALVPHIGHDCAARIVRHAQDQGLDRREAALAVGGVSAEDFDTWSDVRHPWAPD